VLEDLFYGNLRPCDMDGRRDPRIQPLMQELTAAEDALRATLNDAGKEKLDAFANASIDLNLLMMKLSFQEGFRIAAGTAADLYVAQRCLNARSLSNHCED